MPEYLSERERRMSTEAIPRLFFKFSLPAITGMMVQALYNIVDRFFISRIPGSGSIAIGGLGVSLPILFILMGFSMLFGIGGAANISIRLGQKDHEKAEHILGNVLLMLMVSAILLNLGFLWKLEPLLKIFGATQENLPYAKSYLKIILIGNFWNTYAFAFNHLIRAEGSPKIAMVSMLIGAISNTILDPIFIFVFNLGVQGAAYATILAQFLSFLWGLSFFWRGKSLLHVGLRNFKPDLKILSGIVAIGVSPFFIQIAGSVIGALINNNLRIYGGTLAQGAYAIINSIATLFFMPVFGMNQGMQPIVGYNYGAGSYRRVKQTVTIAMLSATVLMSVGWALIQFFPHILVGPMAPDPSLYEVTVKGIRPFLSMLFIVGMQIISSNFFQSIGKARISFFLSLSRQVFLLAPLLYILPQYFGLKGIWYSMPIADGLSFVITMGFLLREFRRLDAAHCEKCPDCEECQ